MNISEQIETQKSALIKQYIDEYKNRGVGLAKALKLVKSDIQKMRDDNLSLSSQIEILNKIFDVKIKYDTYKKWSARQFKKTEKREIKKVAPKELKKEQVTIDNYQDYQVETESKYLKYLK